MKAGSTVAAAALVWALSATPAFTEGPSTETRTTVLTGTYQGISLVGRWPERDEIDGISTTDPETALRRIARALETVRTRSPMVWQRLEPLKQAGAIRIVYDARIPRKSLTEVNIAYYAPAAYTPAEDKRVFLVLVGRTGIQRSPDVLAAAMAHELAGHAVQHLEGRLTSMRELDAECEAFLVHEQTFQDLGTDKLTDEAIGFRRAMDFHWCDDFRRWTLKTGHPTASEWDALNPDVPALLNAFAKYRNAA